MVKSELVHLLAESQGGLSFKDVEHGVGELLECMSRALAGGDRIEIRGFGSFSLHLRPARNARNPKTGEWVQTQAKYTPHFKPGKALRECVNDSRHHCSIEASSQDDD